MRHSIMISAAALALLAGLSPSPPARAQVVVIDPRAIAQAAQQVQQGLREIQALEAQLANQAAMLRRLGTDVTAPLTAIAGQATQALRQAQGIGYNSQNVAGQMAAAYPTSMAGANLAATQGALAGWRRGSAQTLQDAMATQNRIAQAQPAATGAVGAAVAASQGAPGPTAAIQATNQLLAAVATQLTELETLLITQSRAAQIAAAQAQGTQAVGAADSQRFWTTPTPASRVQNADKL